MIKKNKRGWIRIVEAFVSILLISGVLLSVIDKGYFQNEDMSVKVYKAETAILKEIQLDEELRKEIINIDSNRLPISWDSPYFPINVSDRINERVPNYLECEAKICNITNDCDLGKILDKDVYAKATIISANLEKYNPSQLKLFCWTKE